jgi:DNA-binding transcriptional ArsR family regulator
MEHLTQTFAALADPTRLGIVVHLARREATVSELVDKFDLTQPTITSHLKVLESVGLITRTRIGQSRPAQLAIERFNEITKWIGQVQGVWEANYKRLDAVLSEMKRTQEKMKRKKKK